MKRCLLLALWSLCVCSPALRAVEPKSPPEPAASAAEMKPRIFSLDFSGGPLRKLLAELGKIEGISVSMVTAGGPEDLNVELPPFALRNASLVTLFEVLQPLLETRGYLISLAGGADGRNSFVGVLRRLGGPAGPRPGPPTDFGSYQLAPYLGEQTVDDIVGAIRAAWELDPARDREALHLKYHPPTSILLVSGPKEAIIMTMNILSQLKRGAPEPAARSGFRGTPHLNENEKK